MKTTNKIEEAAVRLIIRRELQGIGVNSTTAWRENIKNPLTEKQLRQLIAEDLGLPMSVFRTEEFHRALRLFEEPLICELSDIIRIQGGDKTFPLYLP
jgi:hypothetical protein